MSEFSRVVRFRSLIAVVALAVLAATGCSKSEAPPASHHDPVAAASAASAPNLDVPSGAVTNPRDPAHVTTVGMTLVVASVDQAARRVREETSRVDGYVSTMNVSGDAKDRTVSFQLRVPAARLPALRSALAPLGEAQSENESVEDVGGERADRKARLANARAEEKRLLELLSQRTGSLGDVLSVERELARVRETIERFEAQFAALEGKIAFATINLSLVPRSEVFVDRPMTRIATAAKNGVHHANVAIVGAVILFFEVAPTLLWMAIVVFGGWLLVRVAKRVYARRLASRMNAI